MNKIKIIILILGLAFSIVGSSLAQDSRENKAIMIKEFYQEYCKEIDDSAKITSLFTQYCTLELRNALWEDLFNSDIGYGYLTDGCYDYELIGQTVSVIKEGDHYVVTFESYTPLKAIEQVSVIILLDDKGKLAYIKRPDDGLTIPKVG